MVFNTFALTIMRLIIYCYFNVYTASGKSLQVLPFLVYKLMYTTEYYPFNVRESPKTI